MDAERPPAFRRGPLLSLSDRKRVLPEEDSLLHAAEIFDCLGKLCDRLIGVSAFDAVADAVAQVPFKNHLSDFVQGALRGADLKENILAGNIPLDHAVDAVALADHLMNTAMQSLQIHTVFHRLTFFAYGFTGDIPVPNQIGAIVRQKYSLLQHLFDEP